MIFHNRSWAEAVSELGRVGAPYAIVTILSAAGSTPRAGGTKMVVTDDHSFDSVGGGQLEFLLTQRAREMLATGMDCQEIKQFSLGAEAKQCCGGAVTVLVECFAARQIPLAVFGAGHVARSLISILSGLPFRTLWIDSRAEMFDGQRVQDSVEKRLVSEPETEIDKLPSGSYVLVLTHDHALDFRLAQRLLEQDRWGFFGLIGSENKARRFRARLKREGISDSQIDQMQCPVGMPQVKGKLPMEVAVSIAAKLIETYANAESGNPSKSMNWKQMKQVLSNQSECIERDTR